MMLEPPGLLSTMTGTPRSTVIFSAMRRVITSEPPPGANGTTILMLRVG
jgi:hypothetical protein